MNQTGFLPGALFEDPTMIVVEAFDPTPRQSGRYSGFPSTAIVEDDGLRWLLAEFPIPGGMWKRSAEARATGIRGDWGEFDVLHDSNTEMVITDGNISGVNKREVKWTNPRPFVHLHCHTHYSGLDGLTTIPELLDAVTADGQEYVAITDHGVCAGHLELQQKAPKADVRPVFGVEAYFVNDAKNKDKDISYWHLVLWAMNDRGLQNLWKASTLANLPEHSYYKPRMDWRILDECGEGIMASTACLRGPLRTALLEHEDEDEAIQIISRLRRSFGDNVVVELHTNQLPEQIELNKRLLSLANSQSLPYIVVSDSHYQCADHQQAHKVWLAVQTNKSLQDESDMFQGEQDFHLHTAEEAYESIRYLGDDVAAQAVSTTLDIAKMCDATIKPRPSTPIYHRYEQKKSDLQGEALDNWYLEKLCRDAFLERLPEAVTYDDQVMDAYRERFEFELSEIITKGLSGYHLIVWDYCNWCREQGILLGPARGSSAGSLVCFLLGITQVDPLVAKTRFDRYISPGRTSLPDIDSDFPKSMRSRVTEYIINRWGAPHVVRVGSVNRVKNAGVFKDVARTLKGSEHEVAWEDIEAIAKIVKEAEQHTSGLGLKWDELMDEAEDLLAPYKEKYPVWFHFAERLVMRIRGYAKHAAGLLIDTTESIIDRLPLRQGEDEGFPVTEFPMDALDWLGLVKFDILTLRTLDTIQMTMDLLQADEHYAGKVPHPHSWREEYEDPEVWDMICEGDVLGVFQLETDAGAKMNARILPRNLQDLAAVVALNRPGPMRSGLADSYIARRDGREAVTYPHPWLETVLDQTYGTFIFQEDLMRVTQVIAGYDSAEADDVRSILGKKKVDKIAAEGEKFISRSIANGVDEEVARRLFEQMQEFARYSFNLSHAYSYAMLAFWCAWFKCHYPAHFLVACLSTVDKGDFPQFVMDARRKGFRIDLPDVNESDETFTVSADGLGIRYGLKSIMNFGEVAARSVIENRNVRRYSGFFDFIERRGSKCNFGNIKTLAYIGALDSIAPEGSHRAQLEDVVEQLSTGKLEQCAHLRPDMHPNMGVDVVCGYDWLDEPRVIGKSGKPLKQRPIPKACTKACRQYQPTSAIRWREGISELTPVDIRRREREVLGLYVSSTPFDGLNIDGVDVLTGEQLSQAEPDVWHFVLGEIQTVRPRNDKFGNPYAFISIMVQDGVLDVVVFKDPYKEYRSALHPDAFGLFAIRRNSRGYQFGRFIPVQQR